MTTATKSSVKDYIHYIITAVIIFGFPFLPNIGSITDEGMVMLGAFIGAIYGWTFIDMLWPSILAMFSMGLELGVGTVVAAGLGSTTTWMLMFFYIIIGILDDAKITDAIMGFFLTRKSLQRSPWLLMTVILFTCFVVANFNGFGAEVIFLALLFQMCKMFGIKPYTKFPVVFAIAISFITALTAIILPFRGTAIMMLSAWTGITGQSIDYVKYMLAAFPITFIIIIVYILVAKFILRVDLSFITSFDAEKFGIKREKLNGAQKFALFIVGWMLINLLAPSVLPAEWGITVFLNNLTVFGQTALPIVVFMVVKYKGKRVVNFEDLAARYIPWQMFMMMGVIMPLASFLTADSTGITAFMSSLTQPLLGLGTVGFLILMMAVTCILTNFANNAVVGMIMMPILYSFAMATPELSLDAALLILIFATHFAFLTPGATPFAAVMFANREWIKPTAVYKNGLILIICLFIVALPLSYVVANLVF